MLDPGSPVLEYYPTDFKTDMNGEKKEYMAVVLLPFIDAERLLFAEEAYSCIESLSEEEFARNTFSAPVTLRRDASSGRIVVTEGELRIAPGEPFAAVLMPGTVEGIPGFDNTATKAAHAGGARGGGRQRKAKSSGDRSVAFFAPPRLNKVCKFFLRGACYHGAECTFEHPAVETGPETFVKVRDQVEFYFNEQNWRTDEFLKEAYIENDSLVPVEIVLSFAKMRKLISHLPVERQIELVVTSLIDSEIVALTSDGRYLVPRFLAAAGRGSDADSDAAVDAPLADEESD
jgi:hypothetical protein